MCLAQCHKLRIEDKQDVRLSFMRAGISVAEWRHMWSLFLRSFWEILLRVQGPHRSARTYVARAYQTFLAFWVYSLHTQSTDGRREVVWFSLPEMTLSGRSEPGSLNWEGDLEVPFPPLPYRVPSWSGLAASSFQISKSRGRNYSLGTQSI